MTATPVPAFVRLDASVQARFEAAGGRTHLARAAETGGLRLRCPRAPVGCEAVLINTAGGIAGGDRVRVAATAAAGADATLTTTAAEKIYRAESFDTPAETRIALAAEAGARLEWLPQETILFDGAALRRTLDADVAPDATLTILESVVFGRLARGETAASVRLRDDWRVRRAGKLVFADAQRLDGAAVLDRPACGDGARALATLVHVAPDAAARLDAVRAALGPDTPGVAAACSAWNGLLVMRCLSRSPEPMRARILAVLAVVRDRAAPRVWG